MANSEPPGNDLSKEDVTRLVYSYKDEAATDPIEDTLEATL